MDYSLTVFRYKKTFVIPEGANIIGWLALIKRPVGITLYNASLWLVFGE